MKKNKIKYSQNDDIELIDAIPTKKPWSHFLVKLKEYRYLGISGLISAVAVLLIYTIVTGGLYPFGDGTPLVLDLNSQYVYFFSALRNAIFGEGELLYSFSRSLGGEFLGIYAYYLASPLSYLVCLFPADKMQEFALLLLMLKSALAGMTMGYFLHKHSEKLNKLTIVAFSLLYSLCAYCVVYQTNLMWMDAVIWLPLLTLGIESIVKYGKYKLFVISLALTIASNYYTGYMCCIFVLMYFFYYMFAHKDDFKNNPLCEKAHFTKSLIRIAVFSALAVCIAAVIILSAYYSLSFGKNAFSDPNYDISTRIKFFDVIFKFFPGTYDTINNMNATATSPSTGAFPFVYCGVITLLLAPAFFVSKKFSRKEKIATAVFIGFFIFSFIISTLDLMWHGFQYPNCLQNRYSFMLCFFLVVIAFKVFENLDEPSVKWGVFISAIFWGSFAIVIQKLAPEITEGIQKINDKFELGNFQFALFSIVMIALYLIIIAVMRSEGNKIMISAVLLVVITVELTLNGVSNVRDFGEDFGFSAYSRYDDFQDIMYPIVDTVKDNDDSFYRMEKTFYRQPNDNMQFGIKGIANSTSTLNQYSLHFLKMMGYASRAQWSLYLGGNPVSDSLLGIKYIITDRDLSEFYGDPVFTAEEFAAHEGITVEELYEQTLADKTETGTYKGKSAKDYVVYKNPYALPLGFAASNGVINFNMKELNTYVLNTDEKYNEGGYSNPFERINALYTAILGADETVEIFKPAKQEGFVCSDGITHYTIYNNTENNTYQDRFAGEFNDTITYNYTVPTDKTLYMYLPLPSYYKHQYGLSASAPIADGINNYGSDGATNPTFRIVELGKSETSDYNFTIKLKNPDGDNLYKFIVVNQESYVYYIDTELLAEVTAKIKENQLVIEKYTESSFEGSISTKDNNQLVLTTITYDKYWDVYVDGKKVNTFDAVDTTPGKDGGGALLAFEVEDAGNHSIRMVYRPKIVTVGFIISCAAIIIFVLIWVFEKKLMRIQPCKTLLCIEDNTKDVSNEADNKQQSRPVKNKRKD